MDRPEEFPFSVSDIRKDNRTVREKKRVREESGPQPLPFLGGKERRLPEGGNLVVQGGPSNPEGMLNGLPKGGAVEGKPRPKRRDIPQILHAGVVATELHHRMELLGDMALSRVGPDRWFRLIEQNRIAASLPIRERQVPEAHIHLEWQADLAQSRVQACAWSFPLEGAARMFSAPSSNTTPSSEGTVAIVSRSTQFLLLRESRTEQVHIPGTPERLPAPHDEQGRALES